MHGHLDEGWERLQEVVSREDAARFPLERARVSVGAGVLAYFRGDHRNAAALCAAGLPVCREAGLESRAGTALSLLGAVSFYRGDFDEALVLLEQSLAIARETGNPWLASVSLALEGILALHRGDARRALALCEEGLALARRVGEKWATGQVLYNLGLAHMALGDPARAAACFVEGVELFYRDLNNYLGLSLAVDGLAGVAAAQGDFPRAARLLGAGKAVRDAVHAPVPPAYEPDHQRIHDAARRGLEEAAFAAAWEAGCAMTVEEAIALARGE
jgi:tetratricopeptide (TPR) repeat protein